MPRSILDPVQQAYDVAIRQAYARRTAAIIHEALHPVDNSVPAEVARLERMSREQEYFFSKVLFEYRLEDSSNQSKHLTIIGRYGQLEGRHSTYFNHSNVLNPNFEYMLYCAKRVGENELRLYLWRELQRTTPLTASEILNRPFVSPVDATRLQNILDEARRPLVDSLNRVCKQIIDKHEDWCKGEWFVNEKTGGVQVRRGK